MILFDIETDGLLDVLTKVHCLCAVDTETNERLTFGGSGNTNSIEYALPLLEQNDIGAHNLLNFDLPAVQKIYPSFAPKRQLFDTLVMARLIYPHQLEIDYLRQLGHLNGSHSLEAWGKRLGILKGEYGKTTDWAVCTPEMVEYCRQDVEVLLVLWQKLNSANFPDSAIQLEHEFAKRIDQQIKNGIDFHSQKASVLLQTLTLKQEEILTEAKKCFPTKKTTFTKIPKRSNAKKGYISGVPYTEIKEEPINIGSRQQVIDFFKEKYDWIPPKTTEKGNAVLDSEVFEHLTFPEAKLVSDYLDLGKCIGQLSTGKNSLLSSVQHGKIFGRVNHNGARTGRCSHFSPNVSQIQSPKKIFGKEFRELFIPAPGRIFVGADLKAIELRMLAHYLHHYDSGEYAHILLQKDVHTENQLAAGLETRDQAKRFIFALVYGAGNARLGAIIDPMANETVQAEIGKKARNNFLAKIKGLDSLLCDLKRTYESRGYLTGLDGRKLVPRAGYNALNTLLQGGGAIIAKKWTCLIHEIAEEEELDILQHLHVHDEIILSCHEPDTEAVANVCKIAAQETGEFFKINLPIEAETKIGHNWFEVH
jgi:DNA polymerase I-like protein with 3'-5' exonuclease and polymerase domains